MQGGRPRKKRPTFSFSFIHKCYIHFSFISSFRFHFRVKIRFISISSDVLFFFFWFTVFYFLSLTLFYFFNHHISPPVMYFEISFYWYLSIFSMLLAEARKRSHVHYPTRSHIPTRNKSVTNNTMCMRVMCVSASVA